MVIMQLTCLLDEKLNHYYKASMRDLDIITVAINFIVLMPVTLLLKLHLILVYRKQTTIDFLKEKQGIKTESKVIVKVKNRIHNLNKFEDGQNTFDSQASKRNIL